MISRFRVCTATFAVAAMLSAQASASSLEMARQMDTTAPKYDAVECQEVRAASGGAPTTTVPVVVYTHPSGGNGVAIPAGAAYAAGAIALIMIIGAVKEAERREAIVVDMLIKRCGEEAFVPYFQAKAEKGDADAAAHLGHVYAQKQDWPQSLRWYQVAADHKNVDAQLALGTMYAQGNGVTADRTQAAAWWQKAAGQDSPEANRRLGELYAQDQNYTKAVEYYVEAARRHDGPAALALARMYEQGAGVAHSDRQAFGWYSMATLAQIPDAEAHRGAAAARLKQGDVDDLIREVERCYRNRRCDFD